MMITYYVSECFNDLSYCPVKCPVNVVYFVFYIVL